MTDRRLFGLIALAAAALLGAALYLQEVRGLEPCYLCIVQRVLVIAVGVVAAIAWLHRPGPTGRRLYGAAIALAAFAGAGFSTRQLWLQHLPPERVPACGPPADYLVENFPLSEWLPLLLKGDGNCAEVQWTFLGLSIPGWLLPCFLLFGAAGLWLALRRAGSVTGPPSAP